MIINYEDPQHALFPTAVLRPPFEVQIISSAASSVAFTLYVAQYETKFPFIQNQKIATFHSLIFMCLGFLATDTEVPGSIPGATRFSE
jgi:hypothetical protein